MKPYRIVLGLLLMVAMAGTAFADSTLDLNLNNHSARLQFMTSITPTGLYVNGAYLYNKDRGDVLNLGIHLIGDAGVGPNPLRAGLGGQLYYINPDFSANGEAVGIGGFVKYQVPTYNRIGFGAHIYYAPGIIAFGDIDRLLEYGVRVEYQVLRNANVYIGYRQ
ncbi:MAG TPA: YfaZ family outer membrane protein, partial [Gammaproteobacteria bacterium]|nr:YfaZ family outer membrane protein [Gammaproteobacteria bacterium]